MNPNQTPSALEALAAVLRQQLTGQILGFVLSQALYVATRLGIADLLAAGPRSATELAVEVGADRDGLYRLLRLLAGHGIFDELPGGRFANSAASELLREVPGSLRALALVAGEVAYPALAATRRMVRTGEPAFELVFGAVWEEHLARDPAASKRFRRLVAARKQVLAEVLAAGPWRGTETVVDVVGGNGALVVGLLQRCPACAGSCSTSPTWSPRRTSGSRPRAWPTAARRWPGASSRGFPRAVTSTCWPMSCTAGMTPTPGRFLGRSGG